MQTYFGLLSPTTGACIKQYLSNRGSWNYADAIYIKGDSVFLSYQCTNDLLSMYSIIASTCCFIIISPPWKEVWKSKIFWIFISSSLLNILFLKYEINNYHKIINIIFSFSLVLLSLSSIYNHLLIVFSQCYPLLFLSYNNILCCILPFQSLLYCFLNDFCNPFVRWKQNALCQ